MPRRTKIFIFVIVSRAAPGNIQQSVRRNVQPERENGHLPVSTDKDVAWTTAWGFFVCANSSRVQLKCDATRWRTGGEVKGKLANGVGASTFHTTSEHGVSSITTADAQNSAASSRLN